jgi:hypothetical protein
MLNKRLLSLLLKTSKMPVLQCGNSVAIAMTPVTTGGGARSRMVGQPTPGSWGPEPRGRAVAVEGLKVQIRLHTTMQNIAELCSVWRKIRKVKGQINARITTQINDPKVKGSTGKLPETAVRTIEDNYF